jgi:hypothetical protein
MVNRPQNTTIEAWALSHPRVVGKMKTGIETMNVSPTKIAFARVA